MLNELPQRNKAMKYLLALPMLLGLLVGCGAPSDPVKNLKWHISKVITKQGNAKEEIRQAEDTEGIKQVLQLADRDEYERTRQVQQDAIQDALTKMNNADKVACDAMEKANKVARDAMEKADKVASEAMEKANGDARRLEQKTEDEESERGRKARQDAMDKRNKADEDLVKAFEARGDNRFRAWSKEDQGAYQKELKVHSDVYEQVCKALLTSYETTCKASHDLFETTRVTNYSAHTNAAKANRDEFDKACKANRDEYDKVCKASHDEYDRISNTDIFAGLLQKKQTWYKVNYAIDSVYKCDVRTTDSLTTPAVANVTLSCQVSCSNLFTTKEAAAKAQVGKSRSDDFPTVFGYQDDKWKLLPEATGRIEKNSFNTKSPEGTSLFKLLFTMNE